MAKTQHSTGLITRQATLTGDNLHGDQGDLNSDQRTLITNATIASGRLAVASFELPMSCTERSIGSGFK